MHFSPDEVLVTVEINYKDNMVLDELEELNDRIEKKIQEIIPNAKIYLEPESN
jgi:divalent metal cation (Fe/Co/Zn/Cd) transporter